MKRKFLFIGIAILFILANSCTLDQEENFHFAPLRIIDAQVPESFILNETYVIAVQIERPNDCSFFEGFDVAAGDGGLREIVAWASVLTDAECEEQLSIVTHTMTMEIIQTETYILRFYNGEDSLGNPSYLTYEVPVTTDN